MADSILGLLSSAKFAAEGDRFFNHRRQILHSYPNGGATLTGLLSMVPEEKTNDSIFFWYEKRYNSPVFTLRGTAPATSTAPSTGDANDGTIVVTGATTLTTTTYFKVNTTKDLKPTQVFKLESDGSLWWVLSVVRGVANEALLGYVAARPIRAYTIGVVATVFAAGTRSTVIGTAQGEGQSGTGQKSTAFKRPFAIQNTTEIFYDKFDFPGSVLQMGMKWDETGAYKEKAKDTIVEHMTSLERSILWGKRSTTDRASLDPSQEDLTVRTMSGIEEFLLLWDAGSAGLQIDGATYAPYSFKSPSTVDTDDQKRVIVNSSGNITVRQMNEWAERVGRFHTNKSNEKLILLGSGAVLALVDMFRKNSSFQVTFGDKAYGLSLHTWHSPFGDFRIVTHPLFNEDPVLRYYMMILDIHSLKFRPLGQRDTRLLKNQQNNGDDFRRDAYRTEAGLELHSPEQHMIVQNVRNYTE